MMKHSLNITASGGSPLEELRSDRGAQLINMARMQIIPGASGDDLGVRSKSERSWLRHLRRVRSSPMSPDAPLFVPDVSVAPGDPIRSNGGGFYEVVVAAVDD
jgi:hypothetical protein